MGTHKLELRMNNIQDSTVQASALRQKRTQGMTEYIVVIGLVAIFLIFVVSQYGGNISSAFAGGEVSMSSKVEGVSSAIGDQTISGNN